MTDADPGADCYAVLYELSIFWQLGVDIARNVRNGVEMVHVGLVRFDLDAIFFFEEATNFKVPMESRMPPVINAVDSVRLSGFSPGRNS